MDHVYDLIIVGSGIAGYSAALTAKSLKIDFLWLGEGAFGGKAGKVEYVRNYPAFYGNGEAFGKALSAQAEKEGIARVRARIDRVYKMKEGFVLTAGEESFHAKSVILACGVQTSGSLKGEKEFLGRGVSYCAVCDGGLYRGKKIAAVLSSEEYAEEAEYLASFADTVYCFCRYPEPVFQRKNILVRTGEPVAVEGGLRADKLRMKDGTALDVDGVFLLKDSAPPEALVGGLATEGAHVKAGRDLSTNLAGLFAAGDITGTPYQFAKAAGEGLVAAYSARAFLSKAGK